MELIPGNIDPQAFLGTVAVRLAGIRAHAGEGPWSTRCTFGVLMRAARLSNISPHGARGVPQAEIRVRVVAWLALAHTIMCDVARLHLHLQAVADDIAVQTALQVIPVLRVVGTGAWLAKGQAILGAVLCHKGPRWALLAYKSLICLAIWPFVGWLGAGAVDVQEEQDTGDHPLCQIPEGSRVRVHSTEGFKILI